MADRKENLKKINEELEKLSDDELEQVAGGTIGEFKDLIQAITENVKIPEIVKKLGVAEANVPIINKTIASGIESILQDRYGIDADIRLGMLDIGIFSKNNKYTDIATGKSLTHQEVLKRIRG